jgi:DNA processing protein
MPLEHKEIEIWLHLISRLNLPLHKLAPLWSTIASGHEFCDQTPTQLQQITGLEIADCLELTNHRDPSFVTQQLRSMKTFNVQLVAITDKDYPELLKHIPDPPPVLFAMGDISSLNEKCVTMVGTRKATPYGLKYAASLAYGLATKGFAIVSGFAMGIDTECHQAALRANGKTIAVLGCGLNIDYPPRNYHLKDKVSAKGVLISEFPMGSTPHSWMFPKRNRILAGLSWATIIVEAGTGSGAIITGNYAMEFGRQVYAVPYPLDHPGGKGSNKLIKEGASLIQNPDDVTNDLQFEVKLPQKKETKLQPKYSKPAPPTTISESAPELDATEELILKQLSTEPFHIDNIMLNTGLTPSELLSKLTIMEMKGLINQLPGKFFILA